MDAFGVALAKHGGHGTCVHTEHFRAFKSITRRAASWGETRSRARSQQLGAALLSMPA